MSVVDDVQTVFKSLEKGNLNLNAASKVGLTIATGSIVGYPILTPPVALIALGAVKLVKSYREKRKQAKLDEEMKQIYKEAFEKSNEELIKIYKESEAERKRLIALIKQMQDYIKEFEKKKDPSAMDVAAYNYAKGTVDGMKKAQLAIE